MNDKQESVNFDFDKWSITIHGLRNVGNMSKDTMDALRRMAEAVIEATEKGLLPGMEAEAFVLDEEEE